MAMENLRKRTLLITMNADWRGTSRAAGKRATARSYQREVHIDMRLTAPQPLAA